MLQMWILFSASKLVSVLACVYLCLLTESLHRDDVILALSLASLIVRKPSRIEKPALNALPESEKGKDTLNICIHFYIYIQEAEITQPKSQSYDIVIVLSKVPHCALIKTLELSLLQTATKQQVNRAAHRTKNLMSAWTVAGAGYRNLSQMLQVC